MNVKGYIKNFGLFMFLRNGFSRVLRKAKGSRKFLNRYDNYKHKYVEKWLKEKYWEKDYRITLPEREVEKRDCNIFVFWWQGEHNAPEVVQCCINSIRKRYGSRLVVLSEANYKQYCSLPDYIEDKFLKGNISHAHYSDIIRFYLLYYWGGVWMDATDLLVKDIPEKVFKDDFYTLRNFYDDGLNWKWTSFFIAAKSRGHIAEEMLEFYYAYWKEYDTAITYLFLDCWMTVLYENDSLVKSTIDSLRHEKIYMPFLEVANEKYDLKTYEEMKEESFFFNKLTYKAKFYDYVEEQKTVYKFLKEQNGIV